MIIVAITGPTMDDALRQIRASQRFADCFEFRVDLIEACELAGLLHATRKPRLVTCRPRWEGGRFDGAEDDRLAVLAEGADQGAEYVDLEARLGRAAIEEFHRHHRKARIIVSQHYFGTDVPDPGKAYRAVSGWSAYALKLAYAADDASQIDVGMRFLALAARGRKRAIAVAMGEAGEASRVLYRCLGGWATFAAAEEGAPSAPGQLTASALKQLYGADRLTPSTKVYGLIGNPVRYSKGIQLFNPMFRRASMNAVYCRFPVNDVPRFMKGVAARLAGFSVTKPLKEQATAFAHTRDRESEGAGVVNTLVRSGKWFTGANTDAPGALDAIEEVMPVRGTSVLVLGAGGTARAIAWEAVRRGAAVMIANRTYEKAATLARALGVKAIAIENVHQADIVVNATSVGMAPRDDETPMVSGAVLMKLAFDAVYVPVDTRFLREARAQGAQTVSGFEMFLRQAARQYLLFTGKKPSLAGMRRFLDPPQDSRT